MKIEIKYDGQTLVLTNDNLNNDNFIDVVFEIDGDYSEITAPIDELYSAVVAFKALKDERKEE